MTAQNAILFEVVPDDPEVDLQKILDEIMNILPKGVELKDHKIEPFVFGLKKLKILLIAPESEDVLHQIEEALNSIEGISAEMQSITRL